jgi:ABC-2 type transport system permease protein
VRNDRSHFFDVAAFELRGGLRSPLFWAVSLLLFLLVFGAMATDQISIGDAANVTKNGPYMAVQTHLIMSIFFLFGAVAFVAGAVVRDDETGFGPILKAGPLRKFDYLYGRFAGGFATAMIAFTGVTLAIAIGGFLPWVDPEKRGPLRLDALAEAYFLFALPTIFTFSAILFLVAVWFRNMAAAFVALLGLIVVYMVASFALDKPELAPVLAQWDPFGDSAFDYATRYWTAYERNTQLPPWTWAVIFNRIFDLVLGFAALAAAYPLYRHRAAPQSAFTLAPWKWGRRADRKPPFSVAAAPARAFPSPRFGSGTALAQFWARARFEMRLITRGAVFWVILGVAIMNSTGGLLLATELQRYGGALWPVTRTLIPILEGSFTFFILVEAGFFAGELVWRERDRNVHEIVDATPAPDATLLFPKYLGLCAMLIATLAASIGPAIIIQALKGYYRFEIGEYLLWYLLPSAVSLCCIAALAVFLQALSPNKYWGWGATLLYLVWRFAAPQWGWEHAMLTFGATMPTPLSDMNGQGRFWIGAWWMRGYWLAVSLIMLLLAQAVWRRGAHAGLAGRLRRAPARLRGFAGLSLGVSAVAAAIIGAVVLYNTLHLNPYRTTRGDEVWSADYEKTLLPYENTPQPSVASVTIAVDLHPRSPSIETTGTAVLENRTGAPLRQAHIRFDRDVIVKSLSLEGARPTKTYAAFNYRILTFDTPMAPGERRTLSFDTLVREKGFRNGRFQTRDQTRIVANGTFVDSSEILPIIGMNRDLFLLKDRSVRRRHGLTPELHLSPPGDPVSAQHSMFGSHVWVNTDITVTTDADQIPIAPGYAVSDTTHDGRRTVHFVNDRPILGFFSVQSARYQVRTRMHDGIRMSVYYDPKHAQNVDKMLDTLGAGLDYYQANFSPYQFRQIRITEFPDYAEFAQSFAGTFPWSEGLGFIADYRDPSRVNLVTYIAAHELAHQWWAHQMLPADQQGGTLLVETLAQYSALRVMRKLEGPDKVRKFLKYELDSYLRARGGEAQAEEPLYKVENQGYIHYRKGSLVMYRLADEIGEEAVNRALRNMLARYAFKGPPYPTSLDLIAALRAEAPADKQALITDLFEKITLYDLKATGAQATRLPDGRWRVDLKVDAAKFYAAGKGRETKAPMAENLWVGLFSRKPDDKAFGAGDVIFMQRRPIVSGAQTVSVIVDRKPAFAGVDPYDTLIDRDSDANLTAVK